MRRRWVAMFAFSMMLPTAAGAQVQVPESARLDPSTRELSPSLSQPLAQIYTHPKNGFVVIAPPGARISDKAEGQQISIRSNKGYAVNLQSGLARPDIPLARMSALLEKKYLGDGKIWTARTKERQLIVAGLPAYETIYVGNSMRTRVIITRGNMHDYVFIFMAPNQLFEKLNYEFNWILDNFKSGNEDSSADKKPSIKKHNTDPSYTLPPQRFSEPGFGYVIEYPGNWEFNKPAEMAAMFSGRKGTAAYAAIVGVQNIQPINAKSGDESVKRALNQLKSSLDKAVRKLKVLRDSPWLYDHDGFQLQGRQVMISYVHDGEHFIKHLIAVPRPEGTVAHIWSYTVPKRQFATFHPVAQKILSSWRILSTETR